MLGRIVEQVERMIEPYMKEVKTLRGVLSETNRLLEEQNELLRAQIDKPSGCGCK